MWKVGRCLLASSHAGTRLPIADYKTQGAPPQPATVVDDISSLHKGYRYPSTAGAHSVRPRGAAGQTQIQKTGRLPAAAPPGKNLGMTSYGGIIRIR